MAPNPNYSVPVRRVCSFLKAMAAFPKSRCDPTYPNSAPITEQPERPRKTRRLFREALRILVRTRSMRRISRSQCSSKARHSQMRQEPHKRGRSRCQEMNLHSSTPVDRLAAQTKSNGNAPSRRRVEVKKNGCHPARTATDSILIRTGFGRVGIVVADHQAAGIKAE